MDTQGVVHTPKFNIGEVVNHREHGKVLITVQIMTGPWAAYMVKKPGRIDAIRTVESELSR